MSKVIVFEKELLRSEAFRAIKSLATIRVLIEFYMRRQIHKTKDRKGCRGGIVIANNGKLVFTYEEAKKMGIPQTTFSRSITELVDLGLMDIAQRGYGLQKIPTLYAISERWRLFGTPDFKPVTRDPVKPPYLRKRKKQLPPAVIETHRITTTHGGPDA